MPPAPPRPPGCSSSAPRRSRAAPSTAATSANDRAVNLQDLTPAARLALQNDAGPTGPQGERGAQGPAGARGETRTAGRGGRPAAPRACGARLAVAKAYAYVNADGSINPAVSKKGVSSAARSGSVPTTAFAMYCFDLNGAPCAMPSRRWRPRATLVRSQYNDGDQSCRFDEHELAAASLFAAVCHNRARPVRRTRPRRRGWSWSTNTDGEPVAVAQADFFISVQLGDRSGALLPTSAVPGPFRLASCRRPPAVGRARRTTVSQPPTWSFVAAPDGTRRS